jgi:hypothetical protein
MPGGEHVDLVLGYAEVQRVDPAGVQRGEHGRQPLGHRAGEVDLRRGR